MNERRRRRGSGASRGNASSNHDIAPIQIYRRFFGPNEDVLPTLIAYGFRWVLHDAYVQSNLVVMTRYRCIGTVQENTGPT